MNSILKTVLGYHKLGFSIIPVGKNKKPLVEWKPYQTTRATEEQLQKWWTQFPEANVGIVTGAISGIVVIDVEKGGKTDDLPATVISGTGNGGSHHIYKHPGRPIPNAVKIRELTDIRGDGGFIVAPPSVTDYLDEQTKEKRGGPYEWLVSPDDAGFVELPSWVSEKPAVNTKQRIDWQKVLVTENPEGKRNMTATQLIGKILHDLCPEFWEISGWVTLKEWNKQQNKPPLEEKELRIIWESIKRREAGERTLKKQEVAPSSTQSSLLLKLMEDNEEVTLFHDEVGDPYVRLTMKGHHEIWRIRSKQFKRWLAKSFWDTQKKTANSDALNTALNILEGKAYFEGQEHRLFNRVAWHDGGIWYDLADEQWRAIKVTESRWEIVDNPPILFKRYPHQRPQVEPAKGGDVKTTLKFVNIHHDKDKILFLVYLVSCLIPDIPHPAPNIYGPQGAAKSWLSIIIKRVIDPSVTELSQFPKSAVELLQILSHHWCIFFDNVSFLSDYVSDILCRTVTGAGFSKRELYSDDEDVIYSIKRCVGINGINLVAMKPDLLERSILFELERVSKEKRKTDDEIRLEFERERPKIIGSIMDALVKAMRIKSAIHLSSLPRMADFAVWGCAIAEALGYTKEIFLNAYYSNIENQNKEVLYESLEASALIAFMQDKDEWKGTPSQLLTELKRVADNLGVNTDREKSFPKAANILSKRLNQLKPNIAEAGLRIEHGEENHQRIIHVQKVGNNIVSTVGSRNESHSQVDSRVDSDNATIPITLPVPYPETSAKMAVGDNGDDRDDIFKDILERF